jgi:hypothetical protein
MRRTLARVGPACLAAVALGCVASIATRAGAQNGSVRPLAWTIGAGIGQGSGWPTCEACVDVDHRQGLTVTVDASRSINDRVTLGGELSDWLNYSSDVNSQMLAALLTARINAESAPGFSLKLGAGVAHNELDSREAPFPVLASIGIAYDVGVGYDFPLSARWIVRPYGDFLATVGASVRNSPVPEIHGRLDGNILRFGLDLQWASAGHRRTGSEP